MKSILKEAIVPKHSLRPRGNYTVGYGRPPVATRFQPGRSGNPRGRPRKNRPETLELAEGLSPIHQAVLLCLLSPLDGATNSWAPSTNLERMVERAVAQAINGDARFTRMTLQLLAEAEEAQNAKSKLDVSEALRNMVSILIQAKHADHGTSEMPREMNEGDGFSEKHD